MTTTEAVTEFTELAAVPSAYIEFAVPGLSGTVRVPLVDDPREVAAWIDRGLGAAEYLSRKYAERFPAAVPAAQAPSAPQAAPTGQVPVCNTHNKPMKPSKFGGGFYCATKLADGSYCDQKVG